MGRYDRMKSWIDQTPGLRYAMYPVLEGLRAAAWHLRMGKQSKETWRRRTEQVVACPDNAHIPRVRGAGSVWRGYQLMHNGIRIHTHSYYGYAVTRMLRKNRGVHEPQEERMFREVLRYMGPGAVMVELGAYWGFYSMWFCQAVPNAVCHLVEPDAKGLASGKRNFELNGMNGTFQQAFVGAGPGMGEGGVRITTVDEIVAEKGIGRIDILHSDIQGFELEMLQGAARTLDAGKVDYIFISTHSSDLHAQCRRHLEGKGYVILASADLEESYSFDGLIVARRSEVKGLGTVEISRRGRSGGVERETQRREEGKTSERG
jgi:hypothetical protein